MDAAAERVVLAPRTDKGKKDPMERHEKPDLEQQPEGTYQPPKVIRVSLRPEEAVLGHCKVNGSAGPVSASCRSAVVTCRTIGS